MRTTNAGVYSIRLLGGLDIRRPDGRPVEGLGRKHAALIAYLAAESDGAPRAELAALLWPDKEERRARHNLRMVVSGLRAAFGPDFERLIDDDQERLRLLSECAHVDLRTFEAANPGEAGAVAEARSLYRGRFLEGVKPPSAAYANWATAKASRIEALRAELDARRGAEAMAPARPRRPGRRFSLAVILALAGFAAAAGLYFAATRSGVAPDISLTGDRGAVATPSISVLPFKFTGDDPDGHSFADGLSEEVNSALTIVSDILVVRPASMIGDADPDARQAFAKAHNVRYLLNGDVTRSGERLLVMATLFDSQPPAQEWTYRFERPWGEPFDLQADLARTILSELDIELSSAEWNRIDLIGDTKNVDAWLDAVAGLRHLIRVNRIDNDLARRRYQSALRRDPDYVSALRGLAWTHFLDVRLGWTAAPEASIAKAATLVGAALARAPDDGMAHSLRGALSLLSRDYDGAVAAGERSLALLPNSADASAVLAHSLTYVGQSGRAIGLLRQAMRLSPRHPDWYVWSFGRALRLDGRADAAVSELEKGANAPDGAVAVHLVELALAYAAAGRTEEARRVGARILLADPEFSAARWLNHPAMQDPDAQAREFDLMAASGLPN